MNSIRIQCNLFLRDLDSAKSFACLLLLKPEKIVELKKNKQKKI